MSCRTPRLDAVRSSILVTQSGAFDISFSAHYTLLLAFLRDFLNKSLEAVKFLIAELSEVSKTRHMTVKILSADFAAASKNSGKIFAAF